MVSALYLASVAFPRALRIVRDQETIAASVAAHTAEDLAPHVREASSLLAAIIGNKGQALSRQTALQVPAVVKAL